MKNDQIKKVTEVKQSGSKAARKGGIDFRYIRLGRDYACFIMLMLCISHLLPSQITEDGFGIQPVNAQDKTVCPKFSCNQDQVMNDSNQCFKHSANDPVTEIKVQKCENSSEKCYVPDGKFAWI